MLKLFLFFIWFNLIFLDEIARCQKLADSRTADHIAKELLKAMERYEVLSMQVSAIRDNDESGEIEEWKNELQSYHETMEGLQRLSQKLKTNRKEEFILKCRENIEKLQLCIIKCVEALKKDRPFMAEWFLSNKEES